jgi:hypothetical protein
VVCVAVGLIGYERGLDGTLAARLDGMACEHVYIR